MARALAFCCVLALVSAQTPSSTVVVDTPLGKVRGVQTDHGRYFRGMPYAVPPLGSLRWRRPLPFPGWSNSSAVFDATQFGADCPQITKTEDGRIVGMWPTIQGLENMHEDCLLINVATPLPSSDKRVEEEKWPVMVYLHAGEFEMGAANDLENNWPYDSDPDTPSALLERGVVLVTLNYRLGNLGFLALEELRSRDPLGSTGNYGIQDQREALRWVQKNIAAFGGDQNNVILHGESSGGTGVAAHVAMKESWGLFHKVVMQSPGFTQIKPLPEAILNARFFLTYLSLAVGIPECKMLPFGGDYDAKPPAWNAFPRTDFGDSRETYNQTIVSSARDAVNQCNRDPECYGVRVVNDTSTGILNATFSHSFDIRSHSTSHGWDMGNSTTYLRAFNMSTLMDCIGPMNATTLTKYYTGPYHDTMFENTHGPVPDGVEFNHSIINTLLTGELPPNVTYLMGTNLDEGTEFSYCAAPMSCDMNSEYLEEWARLSFPDNVPSIANGIVDTYEFPSLPWPLCPLGRLNVPSKGYVAATRAIGDAAFTCLVRAFADRLTVASNRTADGSDVYVYYWMHRPNMSLNMGNLPAYGAFHGSEVPFVFGYPPELTNDLERDLSDTLSCYWTNFAHSGDPNSGPCTQPVVWEPYRQQGGSVDDPSKTLILDVNESLKHIRMHTDLRKKTCSLYKDLLPQL